MRKLGCLIGLLAALWPASTAACTCFQPENVCQAFSTADAVLVGEVVSASTAFFDRWTKLWDSGLIAGKLGPDNREEWLQAVRRLLESTLERQLSLEESQGLATVQSRAELDLLLKRLEPKKRDIRFRVIESFKGPKEPVVEISTRIPEGANSVIAYAVGETYLVYLSRDPNSHVLRDGGCCSRNRKASDVEDEIAYLRKFKEGDGIGKVSGFVREAPEPGLGEYDVLRELYKPNPAVGTPVPGARVRLKGEREWIASSDSKGDFEFLNVPPGVYQISASVNDVPVARPQEVRLHEGGCSEERLWIHREIGRLVGTVAEESGTPVSNHTINVIPVLNREWRRSVEAAAALRPTTDETGKFETVLPVGAYFVGINVDTPAQPTKDAANRAGYATTYYPGAHEEAAATAVAISPWESTRIQFTVERLSERRVRGVVVWPNGDPAGGVVVHLEEPRRAVHAVDRVETSADGSFELTGYDGVQYRIVGGAVHPETARSYQVIVEGINPEVGRLVLQPLGR